MQLPPLKTILLKDLILADLPETAGVYVFRDVNGSPVYVGKAKRLRARISSYFRPNLLPKTAQMVRSASSLSYIQVASELEALLLEARLVHSFLPKFNSELKDDKSPLYIGITKEDYPRVLALRKTQLPVIPLKYYYGPFIQAGNVRRIIRLLRRIIPYSNHKPSNRPCVYHQIGLCDPCPSEIKNETDQLRKKELTKRYNHNIALVKRFMSGNLVFIKKELEKQMRQYAREQNYELANDAKSKIAAIDHITTSSTSPIEYIKDPLLLEDIRQSEIQDLKILLSPHLDLPQLKRIECFDNAHLAGTHPTASMVTFVDGEADKTYYRHFKIYKAQGNSDVDMMREVLSRRLKHLDDWGKPDLIIVDGGKPQLGTALEVIGDSIAVVGLAKRYETLVVKTGEKYKEIRLGRRPALYLVQRLRDEAHRFARKLHHKHISQALLDSNKSK